ncbi:TRAP transporter substrate-binding protein [Oceanobacillus longus]|uniref:TRAP transporter substrate-binding protein n=1 Tax=Oceanobacillus longus TaxID=930120 RepID=A0ABV8GZU7_9BACI
MKKLGFLLLMVLLSVALIACGSEEASSSDSGADGDTYKIVAAHSTAETTSFNEILQYFKTEVEEKSENRIEVEIHPNAQLGADRELIEGVQNGDITLSLHSTAPAVNFVEDVAVFDVPFLFPDKETAREVMAYGTPFYEKIAQSQEEKGFKLLGLHDQGFRMLTLNGTKVEEPADLEGVRLRTMENEYHMATWEALGANPTPLPFNEVYTALQQGTVDGQENPYELIVSQRFYEQQEYLVQTNHILQTIQIIMNNEYFNNLPEDLQVIVQETITEAVDIGNKFIDEKDAEYLTTMEEDGTEIVELSPEQLAEFQETTSGVVEQIRENVNGELLDTLLEEVENNK